MSIPPRKVSVLIGDDHAIVRQGLCSLLLADGNFIIVGEAGNGHEAVALAKTLSPDVVVLDIAMPQLNGIDAARQILAARPTARVIMLSAHKEDEYVSRALEIGAHGFLEKQTSSEVLAKAIRTVAAGQPFFNPAILRRLKLLLDRNGQAVTNGNRLTCREREVLQLVAEGAANKQIAAVLTISIKTVEKHRQHLMDKLNIHDTAGLTRYAISTGVIEIGIQKQIA